MDWPNAIPGAIRCGAGPCRSSSALDVWRGFGLLKFPRRSLHPISGDHLLAAFAPGRRQNPGRSDEPVARLSLIGLVPSPVRWRNRLMTLATRTRPHSASTRLCCALSLSASRTLMTSPRRGDRISAWSVSSSPHLARLIVWPAFTTPYAPSAVLFGPPAYPYHLLASIRCSHIGHCRTAARRSDCGARTRCFLCASLLHPAPGMVRDHGGAYRSGSERQATRGRCRTTCRFYRHCRRGSLSVLGAMEGQSTLFKTILGLLPPLAGAVRGDGEPISSWKIRRRRALTFG